MPYIYIYMYTLAGVWMRLCQMESPPAGKGVVGLLSWKGSQFCITFCKVCHGDSVTKPDYYYYIYDVVWVSSWGEQNWMKDGLAVYSVYLMQSMKTTVFCFLYLGAWSEPSQSGDRTWNANIQPAARRTHSYAEVILHGETSCVWSCHRFQSAVDCFFNKF